MYTLQTIGWIMGKEMEVEEGWRVEGGRIYDSIT
jgi:hypothetical protein